jgi:membrane associated rhomboid family serine protease
LIDLQRHMMSNGYSYVSGNPYEWPLPYAVMVKGQDVLLLASASEAMDSGLLNVWQNLGESRVPRGLILVGTEEELEPFRAEKLPGSVAWIRTPGESVEVRRRGPAAKLLSRRKLRRLLEQEPPEGMTASTCQAALQRNLEELQASQNFYDRADRSAARPGPTLTYTLIGACVMLFAAMLLVEGPGVLAAPGEGVIYDWGGLHGPSIRQGQWWRILSSAFLHIGALHLIFNMYALGVFGSLLERLQGRGRVGLIYAVSVVTAALGSLLWHPTVISAGASGGIFGLIGGVTALLIRHRRDFPPHLQKAIWKWLLTILAYNAVLMWALSGMIDNAAHMGGLVGGLAVGLIFSRSPVRKEPVKSWQWALGAVLLAGIAAGGGWIYSRIPPDEPMRWKVHEKEKLLLDRTDRIVSSLEEKASQAQAVPRVMADAAPGEIASRLTQLRREVRALSDKLPTAEEIDVPGLEHLMMDLKLLATLQKARTVGQSLEDSLSQWISRLTYNAPADPEDLGKIVGADTPFAQALESYRKQRQEFLQALEE